MNQQQSAPIVVPIMQAQQPWTPPHNEIPARVRVGMEFLTALTFKTLPRAAVNDITIEWETPPCLTKAELISQATACNMLNEYFLGKLDLNTWENQDMKNQKQGVPNNVAGTIIQCVACRPGPAHRTCQLCHGTGQLLVFPTSEGV